MARAVAWISIVWTLLFGLCTGTSGAQSRPLLQYQHTAWTLQDGAPSQIYALAQTTDGYLWLGTFDGLFRFDGVTFEEYKPPPGQHLPQLGVRSLLATDDGGLWIGYTGGDTSFLKNGVLQDRLVSDRIRGAGGCVYSLFTRRDGTTWAATTNGPAKFVAGAWREVPETLGTDIKSSYDLFEDSLGTLWMTTDKALYRLPPGARQFERTALGGDNTKVVQGADGVLWIANATGIYDASTLSQAGSRPRPVIPFHDFVLDLRIDRSGDLWVTAPRSGITHIHRPLVAAKLTGASQQRLIENFSLKDGLTSEQGLASLEDREGNMWIATADGLDRFRPTAMHPTPLPSSFGFYTLMPEPDGSLLIGTEADGLQRFADGQLTRVPAGKESRYTCIVRGLDGKVWLGGSGSLGYLEHGRFTAVSLPAKAMDPERDTSAMTVGPDGDLWMQTNYRALGLFRLHDGTWSEVAQTVGRGPADAMVTSHDGRVWIGYYKQPAIVIFHGDQRETFAEQQGLTVGAVHAFFETSEGMLIGGEHGLQLMKNNHLATLTFAGETKIGGISGVARMQDGTLWLNSMQGVLRVSAEDTEQALRDPSHPMHYRIFTFLDGLAGKPTQDWPTPSIRPGVGTMLWFTTTNGVFSIDTAHILTNTLAPPVAITNIVADGSVLPSSGPLRLSKGAKDLQIDYTALSLSLPERVRFRYRLAGYDKDWQDAGLRRQAFYTHLPPGHYVFSVIACNNDGVWNDTGASLALDLPPTFLQSWYFKAMLAVLFLASTWLIYLLRMKRETSKLQARVQERLLERERIARELHDTLFQSVEGSLLHLNALTSRLPLETKVKDQLRDAYGEVDRVMGQARSLVFDLRQPVDADDLSSTILLFAEEVGDLSEARVQVQVRGSQVPLKPSAQVEVLKIVKEAVWNAFRHAKARHIEVTISYTARSFEVTVSDDGIGIEPAILARGGRDGHWGLPGIQQRAARLKATLAIRNRDKGAEVVLKMRSAHAYRAASWLPPFRLWRFPRRGEQSSS